MSELPEVIRFRLPATTSTPRSQLKKRPVPAPVSPAPVDTVDEPAADLPSSATAGTPGFFTPEDFRPRTVAEMKEAGVVPIPVSPWAEGEAVRLDNNNYCHWNGETWRSGRAPALT